MKHFETSLYTIMFLLLISCKTDNSTKVNFKEIKFHKIKDTTIEGIFNINKVKIIPLETLNDILISGKYKLKIIDDYIFILDQGMGQMYRFDNNGKFINKIGSIGKGPHEYIKPHDFYIDTHNKTVEILNGKQTTVSKYTYDGRYISKFKFDFRCLGFIKNNERYYFYCGVNGGLLNKYRIIYTDSTRIYAKLLKNIGKPGVGIISDDNNMLLYDKDNIYLKEHFLPDIYFLKEDSAKKILKFDFGNQTINHGDLDKFSNLLEFYKTITKNGFYGILNFFACDNKFISRIHYQKQNENSKRYFIFYDANNDYIKKVLINKKDILFWEGKFHGYQNDSFVFSIDAFKINSIYNNRPTLFSKLSKVKDNDNPVIFVIHNSIN